MLFAFFLGVVFQEYSYAEREVTILWDKVFEWELEGYKVYYKRSASGEPYDGQDAVEGPSPIILPLTELSSENEPWFTLTGLGDEASYYFVVTSYDNRGLESEYSNEVLSLGPGDMNQDEQVDSGDAVTILRYSVGLPIDEYNTPATEAQLRAGNVTCEGDSKVDSGDAIRVLQYSVGLIDTLQCP